MILHYVDELGGVHDASDSLSAFRTFSSFCALLGIRLKSSKAQPPATRQSLLGVRIQVQHDGVQVAPEPRRLQKLNTMIQEALDTNQLQDVFRQQHSLWPDWGRGPVAGLRPG